MRILLASASPRRRELLTTLGHEVAVIAPTVVELAEALGEPKDLALANAIMKARAVYGTHGQKDFDLVLAADTIVVLGQAIFGKPSGDGDARQILKALSNKSHQVITAYCLIRHGKELARSVSSSVLFRKLSDLEIASYVQNNEVMDKAGAYAAQGNGVALIREISGSISNVVGMPIEEFLEDANLLIGS